MFGIEKIATDNHIRDVFHPVELDRLCDLFDTALETSMMRSRSTIYGLAQGLFPNLLCVGTVFDLPDSEKLDKNDHRWGTTAREEALISNLA